MFLVSSSDIVGLYISLETTTIPLYLLISWKEKAWSAESGIKYTLLGMFSSVFLLLGLSYLYGITGCTDFYGVSYFVFNNPIIYFISLILFISVGFKMTLVPFHMWIADVYYGAATVITAYLSVFSKIIGIVLIWNIFYKMLGNHIVYESTSFIAIISAITMSVGNILAITQTNIKRIMAFSSISQAGYMLLGFIGGSKLGMVAIFYYLLVYSISNLTVFCIIIYYKKKFNVENINDYNNLYRKAPLMSLFFLIALLSLAGIPPLSGFVGKFFLFYIAAKKELYWLVLIAAINSTVSLYYYLIIIKKVYIDRNKYYISNDSSIYKFFVLKVVAMILTISIVGIGVFPVFYNICYNSVIFY